MPGILDFLAKLPANLDKAAHDGADRVAEQDYGENARLLLLPLAAGICAVGQPSSGCEDVVENAVIIKGQDDQVPPLLKVLVAGEEREGGQLCRCVVCQGLHLRRLDSCLLPKVEALIMMRRRGVAESRGRREMELEEQPCLVLSVKDEISTSHGKVDYMGMRRSRVLTA